MSKFGHVIVIGYGSVTKDVLETIHNLSEKYNYTLEYVEHEVYPFNVAMKYADANGIERKTTEEKSELKSYFLQKAGEGKLLIVSASNNYLFPAELIEKENVTIINYHSALLPEFPGRNAPTWAIFEGAKKTGITWHYVNEGVDTGKIIIQKECEITESTKALDLVITQMKMASEAFDECIEDVLSERVNPILQPEIPDRRVYKSKEIPGNGAFSTDDNPDYIYRLLRSTDYGKTDVFPAPRSCYNGKEIVIKRYKIVSLEDVQEKENTLFLPMEDDKFLMLKYAERG